MKQFWEERYKSAEYIYGIRPNEFFKACLAQKKPGKVLLPAEGEGRNAVYAALNGWTVEAFDYSEEGRKKALKLAQKQKVTFSYSINEYDTFIPTHAPFDLIALIYTHSDPTTRRSFHRKLIDWLIPGGEIILEGFSKEQLGRGSGGPKNADMLWSLEELEEDFAALTITQASELEITLHEGAYHQGDASVVRFIARKDG